MVNRLGREKSPYLLQHAENPVDWYAWGDEALRRARDEDKPILVSIGYSACHWCHVMAHESFEDPATARLMNDLFVNIKVDREERPDVDSIYMEAVQALTGQGGWPLNVFLTPDGRPFFGGTYFPPNPMQGRPSWRQVLESVGRAYHERREDVQHNAEALTDYIRSAQGRAGHPSEVSADVFLGAYSGLLAQADWELGGFGSAPKFPQPLALELLLRMWRRLGKPGALDFVRLTLQRMADGGMRDQIGGGFHRYSVDAAWVVPHFEKMLYDNALLARLYTLAYQATHDPALRAVAESTLDFMLEELRSPEGAFFSAQDADSEGEEGKFYVWTPGELQEALGAQAEPAALRYGVTPGGNFEGKTILTAARTIPEVAHATGATVEATERELEGARRRLLQARAARVAPSTDTKILTAWNALAIRALAEAAWPLRRPDYLAAARRAADFVLSEMRPDGRLVRSFRDGPSAVEGFLEDYAFLTEACISLYETTFEPGYLELSERLADELLDRFGDAESDLLFDTAGHSSSLVVRPRSIFDNPIPSGSSAAAFALLRIRAHTDNERYREAASATLGSGGELLARAPQAVPYLLCAADFYLAGALQVAVIGDSDAETEQLLYEVFDRYLPQRVLAVGSAADTRLLAGREPMSNRPTAFVCRDFACRLPVNDPAALADQLDGYAVS